MLPGVQPDGIGPPVILDDRVIREADESRRQTALPQALPKESVKGVKEMRG